MAWYRQAIIGTNDVGLLTPLLGLNQLTNFLGLKSLTFVPLVSDD